MRSDTVAHWCAALAVADVFGLRVKWSGDGTFADFSDFPDSPPSLDRFFIKASKAPLLIVQGRRDLVKGAMRAKEWIANMPGDSRDAEWRWLLSGEREPMQIHARKNMDKSLDTYSLGRLLPGAIDGPAITAWLPLLACHGAALLNGGRQKWQALHSQHPDVSNALYCLSPEEWVTPGEIAQWYILAAETRVYELRPVAGEMMSYCRIFSASKP